MTLTVFCTLGSLLDLKGGWIYDEELKLYLSIGVEANFEFTLDKDE